MYDFVDRRLDQQIYSVRMTVWAMRQWIRAVLDGRCVCALIACAFRSARVPGAADPLLSAMRVLVSNLKAPLRLGAVDTSCITEHEAVLLGALVAAAEGREQDCRAVASQLVHADMVPAVTALLIRLARAFAEADMHLVAAEPRAGHEG
jgi:hypothetical protein